MSDGYLMLRCLMWDRFTRAKNMFIRKWYSDISNYIILMRPYSTKGLVCYIDVSSMIVLVLLLLFISLYNIYFCLLVVTNSLYVYCFLLKFEYVCAMQSCTYTCLYYSIHFVHCVFGCITTIFQARFWIHDM